MNTAHVTATTGLSMLCVHCRMSQSTIPGATLDRLADSVRGFLIMHRRCEPGPVASPQLPLPGTQDPKPPVRASDWLRELAEDDGREPPPDVFAQMYPPARTTTDLCLLLALVLPLAQYPGNDAIAKWHPRSGIFDGIAHWARVERARSEGEARAKAGEPAIPGLYIPARLPMPEPLCEALRLPVKPKRGARPLTSPKGRRGKA